MKSTLGFVNNITKNNLLNKLLICSLTGFFVHSLNAAPPVNPPNIPLETGTGTVAKPNLVFLLDDSGSMEQDFLGDEMMQSLNCKTVSSTNVVNTHGRACSSNATGAATVGSTMQVNEPLNGYAADAPFFAYKFNKMYYNPEITYAPGMNYQGNSLGNQTLGSARKNIYSNATTVNLNNYFKEVYFCTKPGATAAELNNSNICRRNGVDTPNPFHYASEGYPNVTFKHPQVGNVVRPFYYKIVPIEYCDSNLNICESTSNSFTNPAYVRWCVQKEVAAQTTLVSGKYPDNFGTRSLRGVTYCQAKYDNSNNYRFPRYGKLQRVEITAAEETNFANWFTYYRNRMLAVKTSTGLAFQGLNATKRVGFMTINFGTSKFLPVKDFDASHKQAFYTMLYNQNPSGGTPSKTALSRVGRYYAGKTDGINSNMINTSTRIDPVQYSCQQNFTLFATDGYWTDGYGVDVNNNGIINVDNVDAGFSTRAEGVFDGGLGGSGQTLADVSLYYYQTDLRPDNATGAAGLDVSDNNVPTSNSDNNPAQHMVTYTMSLGLEGFMDYTPDYYKGTNTDLQNIKAGASGVCKWTSGVCNWPSPTSGANSVIDDLWHAAVNGRGRYYNTQNSDQIVSGLQDALNSLITQTASSAAAATSSPNITATDNLLFYTTYRTNKWDGEIEAREIDPNTGNIGTNRLWSARTQLNTRISDSNDSRRIYFSKPSATNGLENFTYNSLNSTERGYFDDKCSGGDNLNQCTNLWSFQRAVLNTGIPLVNWVRGQTGFETDTNGAFPLFRSREFALGDIVDSSPVYVAASPYKWNDAGYTAFANSTTSRTPMLYVGANDGMIHAINTSNGYEEWAVIPKQVMPKLYKHADTTYSANHQFSVDGTFTQMDAYINGSWKTLLVGGMGPGGNGYIALDITNPTSPKLLWEMCKDATLCAKTDSELGYSYGNPIITKRAFDNKWVVYLSAGYDNSTGRGLIYEVEAGTGNILRKLYTPTGTNASPAGVAKINAYYKNFYEDNKATALYAGDLDGNIWKWDLTSNTTNAIKLGTARDASGNAQPITTKPELGVINNNPVLFFGTGKYLNPSDYNSATIQSVYGIKDSNTDWGNLRANSQIIKQTISPTPISSTSTAAAVDWDTKIGWYFDLTSQTGERINLDPILALGTLNVISNVPGATVCTAGGNSWNYQINFLNGSFVPGTNGNIIARKLPGGLSVGQVVVRLAASGGLKNFITDASGSVNAVGVTVNLGDTKVKKSGWREIFTQ